MTDAIRVLLVNPPIYDFTAYDFWLRPYGMLRAAGRMRHACDLTLFDFLVPERQDAWGRGKLSSSVLPKPGRLMDIPRHYRRYGRPREEFQAVLRAQDWDVVLIQSSMTYWYPGIREVIEEVRRLQPGAFVVTGGVYATLCPEHARGLGPDLVIEGDHLEPLWHKLGISPNGGLPFWCPPLLGVGVMKLTEGCPFRCTYCSVPVTAPDFSSRETSECVAELEQLVRLGARHVAFYDDALLFQPQRILMPFLREVIDRRLSVQFHTPNALNARFLTGELASLMVRGGFCSFFLGFESSAYTWQRATGGKVYSDEFAAAVTNLQAAGARHITSYVIVGHPESGGQDLEASIRFAGSCGTRVLLSEFSPIPGTADAEKARPWADLAEPLDHNKTAFTLRCLGRDRVERLKALVREQNLKPPGNI